MTQKQESGRKIVLGGRLAVFVCATLWSTSGLFIKLVDAHPFIIAGLRSLIAAVTMIVLRAFFVRKPFRGLAATFKAPAFWTAAAAYSATMITFVVANKLTASANVILLQYSAPVWAALLSIPLIKEKPRLGNVVCLAFVICGLVIIFYGSLAAGSLAGDVIALISGILLALNSVCMRMQKNAEPAYSMAMSHIMTAVVAVPFFFIAASPLTVPMIGAIFFMGTIQVGLASILFAYGMKRVNALSAMIIACIEPVLNPLWVFVVTGEKPALNVIAGGAVIIIAVALSARSR
jgi:drug/metabolite transporter (DMT)-like permease